MSRAERRAYKRMTKNQDPHQLPAAARRGRPPRPSRRARSSGEFRFITGRFLVWALGGAGLAGLLGLSLAWPNGMPMAAYVGLAVGAAWLVLAGVVRLGQRRMASLRAGQPAR